MTVRDLLFFALGGVPSLGAGWAFARLQLARHSALLNDAIRRGTARTYASTPDGRNANRLPRDRYNDRANAQRG